MNKHLYLFFLTHFTYSMLFSVFGPVLPYLAQSIDVTQSEFTYIFVIRGICFLLAGFCHRIFFNQYCMYKRMLISCIISGICCILFQLLYPYYYIALSICILMNIGLGSVEVLINNLLVSEVKGNVKQAVGISYSFYGLGAILSSLIVSFLGINSLLTCGISIFVIGMMYFNFLPSRDRKQNLNQQMIQSTQVSSMKQTKPIMRGDIQQKLCYSLLLYSAISLAFNIWFPSFLVIENLASKQTAALSISVYNILLTVFRFLLTFMSLNIIKSLNFLSFYLIVALVFLIGSYYINMTLIVIFGSPLILGTLLASYLPFLYSLPSQFNMRFSQKGVNNMVIYYATGQALLSAFVGYLMDWFFPLMLLFSLLFFTILNRIVIIKTMYSMNESQKQGNNPQQIQMKEIF